jgi:hypothetical protein
VGNCFCSTHYGATPDKRADLLIPIASGPAIAVSDLYLLRRSNLTALFSLGWPPLTIGQCAATGYRMRYRSRETENIIIHQDVIGTCIILAKLLRAMRKVAV